MKFERRLWTTINLISTLVLTYFLATRYLLPRFEEISKLKPDAVVTVHNVGLILIPIISYGIVSLIICLFLNIFRKLKNYYPISPVLVLILSFLFGYPLGLITSLINGFIFGLTIGLIFGVVSGLINGFMLGFINGILNGLMIGLAVGLIFGIRSEFRKE
jgi:hypothetical protein